MKSVIYCASATVLLSCLVSGFQPARPARTATTSTVSRPPSKLFVQNENYQDWDTDYIEDDDDYGYDADDYEPLQEHRQLIETTNSVLKTAHRSFQHVETMANHLLQDNPLAALGIFVVAGLLTAYGLGFVLLDGDLESLNPAANGAVPYWDEEILVMTRKIH